MRYFSSGDYSGKSPSWYWSRGLHDAEIAHVEFLDFPYDYTQRNPVRNCLKLYIDASDAMFDTGVKSIQFFNYKILQDDSSIGGYEDDGLEGCYWMQDRLYYENGKYILEIIALGEDDFKFVIQFENAAVER